MKLYILTYRRTLKWWNIFITEIFFGSTFYLCKNCIIFNFSQGSGCTNKRNPLQWLILFATFFTVWMIEFLFFAIAQKLYSTFVIMSLRYKKITQANKNYTSQQKWVHLPCLNLKLEIWHLNRTDYFLQKQWDLVKTIQQVIAVTFTLQEVENAIIFAQINQAVKKKLQSFIYLFHTTTIFTMKIIFVQPTFSVEPQWCDAVEADRS